MPDPLEPHFQDQQGPKQMVVVAAAALVLFEHVPQKPGGNDSALKETRGRQVVPQ